MRGRWGSPPSLRPSSGNGVPLGMDLVPVEVLWDEDGVNAPPPPPPERDGTSGSIKGWRWGTSPPPSPPEQTHACENVTSRRTTYAGGKHAGLDAVVILLYYTNAM